MWYGAPWKIAGYVRGGVIVRHAGAQSDATRILKLLSKMSRDRPHISAAQKQRAQILERAEKFGPSYVYLQVLGSGYPHSLYLFTDQKRYLFNCGEGTQRLAHEHKVKLSRMEHILLTSKSWRHIGGLPGVALTLQDVGVPKITLHGPPGLDELFHATRRFVIMKDMEISAADCSPSKDFEDNVMTIKYVPIGPDDEVMEKTVKPPTSPQESQRNEFEDDDTDYYVHESKNKPRKATERKMDTSKPSNGKPAFTLGKKSNCSVSYICTLKKRLGTLDLAKCVERGVKPGPLLGLLKEGKDVLLDDGTLVLSADVKTPDQFGPVFIVLDVPDVKYLKESDFREHFDDGRNPPENVPAVIAHFTPKHVAEDPRYKDFLRRFGPTCQHISLNTEDCSGSVAVHRIQHKLHLLHPTIFPLLRDPGIPPVLATPCSEHGEEVQNTIALAQFELMMKNSDKKPKEAGKEKNNSTDDSHEIKYEETRTLTTYQLRPNRELYRSSELKLNIQEYITETMVTEGFPESLQRFRKLLEERKAERNGAREYPKIVFLGTGSCIPNKTRNTSGILLHLDEKRCMLLDCGEGTYGQLVRFYGTKHIDSVLASLRAIYVSHLHADHHIGLIGVLQGRRRALNKMGHRLSANEVDSPVYLLAPGQILTWLSIYDNKFQNIHSDFQLIPNQTLLRNPMLYSGDTLSPAILSAIGLRAVTTCQVQHCPNSFGVCLQVDSGERITYSGDTMPCDELVEIGEDSELLIHEATFEDELVTEARVKKHSTMSQAVEMGRRMRARHTLLTHFSQRYSRLPRLSPDFAQNNQTVGIAFDNMQVTMSDLDILAHMYSPLQLMFSEHCQEMENRAQKRANKRDLRRASGSPHSTRKLHKPAEQGSCVAAVDSKISDLSSS